ncbi:MAG: oxygen-insensitive NAD(P)H nitroreductase, partial [Gammaproteobacteria bacterium]|nr:oxygen-insensitive NAD(P)H nitroreductase [Gammaproteobacteria bacterium]
MDITEITNKRYATKAFDATKKISAENFEQIKSLLRLSPSSVNSQPWHFIIAHSEEAKKRITKGTQGVYNANESKVMNASHVILFCTKTTIDDQYLQAVLEQEDKDKRFGNADFKVAVDKTRHMYANMHRFDNKDAQHWMEKQTYLNLGTILLGAAVLGIDAVPLEGLDAKILNEEFSLIEKGYTATV